MTGIAETHRPLEPERRPHPVLAGTLAVVVLLLVVAWIVYDPVEAGDVSVCPPNSSEVPADEAGEDAEDTVCSVSNLDTRSIEFAASAYNAGLVPVRVTEVGLRGEIQGVFTVDEVLMWPENDQRGDVDADLVPFEAFRLPPGDERLVWVRASVPDCADAPRDRVLLFRELPLRTTLLGLPRDSGVPLGPAIRVIVERC